MKHFTNDDGTEHFLAVANMLNGSAQVMNPGQSAVYRWNGMRFELLQSVQTDGAVAVEAFVINGRSFCDICQQHHTSTARDTQWCAELSTTRLDLRCLSSRKILWAMVSTTVQRLDMFYGVAAVHFRICRRDYLAVANQPNRDPTSEVRRVQRP